MQADFNDLEILKIAISMEEEGAQFYTEGAKYTTGQLKEFLLHAAGQEIMHKQRFSQLFEEIMNQKKEDNEYLFEPYVAAYLKSLIANQVFSQKPQQHESFKDIKSAAAHAVKVEEATVELYTRMHEGAKYQHVKDTLEFLIKQEKEHVAYFKKVLEHTKEI